MASRLVLNYPLPPQYYDNTGSARTAYTHQYSHAMATQRSNESTDSSWSITSAESFQHQPHGDARYTPTTHAISQYSSCDTVRSKNHRRETSPPPKTPSEKSDRESKEPQFCWHEDCLDAKGRPTRHFTRKADLLRHDKSTHNKQYFDCPKSNCNRKGEQGFTRLDHRTEHLRGFHGKDIAKRTNSNGGRSRSRDA